VPCEDVCRIEQRRVRDCPLSDLGPYEIIGAQVDVPGAEKLKEISPHQFEWWEVVARPSWPWAEVTGETPVLHARPAKDHKKGADTSNDAASCHRDRGSVIVAEEPRWKYFGN
jgi:hypothetical protein